MTVRLGLTGGLASGKSTVAELLAARGCEVVDADRLVADLYRPGEPGAAVVRDLLGADHLTAEGGVDRPRVAAAVFADADLRRRLERAVWPLVRRRFGERAASAPADAVVVLEATLLVEAGFAPSFDLVVTVEAPRETRLARAVARGLSEEEARARLEAQGDGEARRAAAHRRIDNDGTLEQLEERVDALLADVRGGRLPDFVFVTGNRHKAAEAERILGRPVECADLELPEIQSLDLVEVLRTKADAAWQRLGRPLVVEESGLDLMALNGFPGPLVKWMLGAAGAAGLARTGLALGEPRVTSRCALLYRHGPSAEDATLAEATVDGELVLPPRGDGGFGWDPVVVPAGEEQTLAELGAADKDALSPRGRAWRELRRKLAGWV